MKVNFSILSEDGRKSPHGLVVHVTGEPPKWYTTNKAAEKFFNILFGNDEVFANVPAQDGTVRRHIKTYNDSDFLDFASTSVNLPLVVTTKGSWETEGSLDEAFKYLVERFFGEQS